MKKKIVMICIVVAILVATTIFVAVILTRDGDIKPFAKIVGVWCWNEDMPSQYVDFAKQNGVNEIYYCANSFDEININFISTAKDKGIKVYWLSGDCQWIEDWNAFEKAIDRYIQFNVNSGVRFDGVHLDVEPHQFDDFEENREYYIQRYVDFARRVVSTYDDIKFDFDIPFWLDDLVSIDGEQKEAYKAIIDLANRTFVMSYRDSAQAIYEVAKQELEYAQQKDKFIFLSVETADLSDDDIVTFYEEGREYMEEQLYALNDLIFSDYGLSIHYLTTWYEMN